MNVQIRNNNNNINNDNNNSCFYIDLLINFATIDMYNVNFYKYCMHIFCDIQIAQSRIPFKVYSIALH